MSGATVEMPRRTRGIVTVCLMIATLMQALDSTIANVALPYMQGSLSASYDQITWVLTSYTIMAAIFTAPVGWLAAKFGRKNLLIVCLIGFTITSMLCGAATSLVEIVLFRMAQGAFGAALVPLSQSTMLDIFPAASRGSAMAIWSMGVMVGPILGPTLGGYLTSDFNWRWVFYVNLPFGIAGVLGLLTFMPSPTPRGVGRFDWTGFGVLCLGLSALQVALDRGDELDWLSSPVIIGCFLLAALGFYMFVVHLLLARNTFIPVRIFSDRNFVAGLLMIFSVGLVLMSSSALLAPYLENLSGYPVAQAGLVMAPRGLGTMAAMMVAGRLLNRQADPRLVIFVGFLLLGLALYMQEGWLPSESTGYLTLTIIVQGAGLGCVFVPLQVIAFYTLAPELRTQGTSLLSLVRNVGAAIGVSLTSSVLDHMSQYEHAVLAANVTPFSRPLQGGAMGRMLNPGTAHGAALVNSMVDMQAQIIAYMDDYKFMLITTIPAALCLLLMRRPPRVAAAAGAAGADEPAHVMD